MAIYSTPYAPNELYHYGVKGMHWGVRRYQNYDGTRTAAGKKHDRQTKYFRGLTPEQKAVAKKVAIGAAVTAAVVGGLYVTARNGMMLKALAKTNDFVLKTGIDEKVFKATKKLGKIAIKSLKGGTEAAGKTAVSATLLAVGSVAVAKLGDAININQLDDKAASTIKKIAYESGKTGINTTINNTLQDLGVNNNGNSSTTKSNNSKTGSVDSRTKQVAGEPSKKSDPKKDPRWNNFFKDSSGQVRSEAVRSEIKRMASAGYDADQIQKFVDAVDRGEIKHCYRIFNGELIYRGIEW